MKFNTLAIAFLFGITAIQSYRTYVVQKKLNDLSDRVKIYNSDINSIVNNSIELDKAFYKLLQNHIEQGHQ